MMNGRITKYVSDWLARADENLALVKLILEQVTGSPNLACFHAQQAAEKYLKGFLAHHELHVRKIHDLAVLTEECIKVELSFSQIRDDTQYLNQFYIESRYPDDFIPFERQDAEKAMEAVLRIKEFVLTHIERGEQKGFGITVVIIVIAAVALLGGGFWYARTMRRAEPDKPIQKNQQSVPSAASQWKTYRNEKYGFEVKYPENMMVRLYPSIVFQNMKSEAEFDIGIYEPQYDGIIEGEIPQLIITSGMYGMKGENTRIFRDASIDSEGIAAHIYFRERDRIIAASCILFDGFKTKSLKGLTLCNRIVSTFKFTK